MKSISYPKFRSLFALSTLSKFFAVISLTFACSTAYAQPPRAILDALTVSVLSDQQPTDLRVLGRNVQDVDALLFSHPGISATLVDSSPWPMDTEPQKDFGHFLVRVDESVEPGYYEVWASGRYGVTNPRLVLVLPKGIASQRLEANPNTRQLGISKAIYGSTERQKRQRIEISNSDVDSVILCATTSLDSYLLPRITIQNLEGQTVQSSRGGDRQPKVFAIPKGFEGTLEIADEMYRGGDSFTFCLIRTNAEASPFFLPERFYPPAAITAFHRDKWNTIPLPVRSQASEVFEVTSPAEVVTESPLPFRIRLRSSDGQPIECEVQSHALGHATDWRLSLIRMPSKEGEKLQLLQTAEDSPVAGTRGISFGSLDPSLVYVPGDGKEPQDTLLEAVNLQSRSAISNSSQNPIRVRIGPVQPRFAAGAHFSPWTNNPALANLTGAYLPAGSSLPIHVTILRHGGFSQPIQIVAKGLPAGITVSPLTIPSSMNEGIVVLNASEDCGMGTASVQLFAIIQNGESTTEQPVTAAAIFQPATVERGLPLSRLSTGLPFKFNGSELSPITISRKSIAQPSDAGPSNGTIEVHAGEKIPIPLAAVRRAGGEAKCILRGQYLPPKSTLPDIELPPNVSEITPELSTTKETPPGEYTICFQGEMVWKLPLHPESHARYVAYRDRLVQRKSAPTDSDEPSKIDASIAAANARIEQLAKETTPRDFPTFFYTAPTVIRVLPAKP